MRNKLSKLMILLAAGAVVVSLTACGSGTSSISSLTDNDSATSSVATAAAQAANSTAAVTSTASAATGVTTDVPAITPSVVSGTTGTAGTTGTTSTAPAVAATPTPTAVPTATPTPVPVTAATSDVAEPSAEEDSFEAAGEGNTGTTTTDVKFRSEPDADNGDDNVIDEIDEGTTVTILGREGNFYRVEIDGEEGYIYSDYIE